MERKKEGYEVRVEGGGGEREVAKGRE